VGVWLVMMAGDSMEGMAAGRQLRWVAACDGGGNGSSGRGDSSGKGGSSGGRKGMCPCLWHSVGG
jgi:hypothetical protein